MKKFIVLAMVLFSLCIWVGPSFADSPVTSTPFYAAYYDYDIVKKAATSGKIDQEIATYLSGANNPTDVKAAVINALGWGIDGKNNAELYTQLVYGKALKDLDTASLSGDQLFVIGYLRALDDYFEVKQAGELLDKAEQKVPDSLTVALVTSLIKAQSYMDDDHWSQIWAVTEKVLENKNLKNDMRIEAKRIIVDYMSLYYDTAVLNPFAKENYIQLTIGEPDMYVNGSSFEIDLGRGTKPEIKKGRAFLPISSLVQALAGTTTWNGAEKKVSITLGPKKIELWIGKQGAVVDGVEKQLEVNPYIANGRTMLPLRFIVENLGYQVGWDGENQTVTITVPNPQYSISDVELKAAAAGALATGDYGMAYNYYGELVKANPNSVEAYEGKVQALLYVGELDEILDGCDSLLKLDPGNKIAYYIRGCGYVWEEEHEKALKEFDKALQIDANYLDAYNAKAGALSYLERYEEAIACYDLMIKLEPNQAQTFSDKGDAYYYLERYEEAIGCYNQVLKIDPEYIEVYMSKGSCYYDQGQYEEAIKCYDQYIAADDLYEWAYYYKACCLALVGKNTEAIAELKKAIEINPELKEEAKDDSDFKKLKYNKEFINLLK